MKGKVNQSMALGVPTVVTSIAAEGMHLRHEHDVMIADDPEAFAAAVVRLYSSEELWNRLSANGRASVRKHFSVEASSHRVDELLEWAGVGQTTLDVMERFSARNRAMRALAHEVSPRDGQAHRQSRGPHLRASGWSAVVDRSS